MPKRVLNVGQCGPDNDMLSRFLTQNFSVTIRQAETHDEALAAVQEEGFELVLLNRIYDATGSQGVETLRSLKSIPATADISVMLVSNLDEAQQEAVAEGALPGFGKAALQAPETIERLSAVLQ
ncbi:MAG: hypothetical protein P8J33_00935 [Pirellulaceae bacterium]|nr:hypothetical protein [Pirellulaceae bacterium]